MQYTLAKDGWRSPTNTEKFLYCRNRLARSSHSNPPLVTKVLLINFRFRRVLVKSCDRVLESKSSSDGAALARARSRCYENFRLPTKILCRRQISPTNVSDTSPTFIWTCEQRTARNCELRWTAELKLL